MVHAGRFGERITASSAEIGLRSPAAPESVHVLSSQASRGSAKRRSSADLLPSVRLLRGGGSYPRDRREIFGQRRNRDWQSRLAASIQSRAFCAAIAAGLPSGSGNDPFGLPQTQPS